MTRDEALQVLELTEGAESDAVRRAYEAKAVEHEGGIASAPTPRLREQGEEQTVRLREARDLLLSEAACSANPSPLSLTKQLDLPARTPAPLTVGSLDPSDMPDPAIALGLTAGRILADRYEIRAHLGSGGMGAVLAAFDRVRNEEVALKVLLPHLLRDPKALERFQNEARIASNLTHPNIVRVYDLHQTAGFTFLTMELLKGHNLRQEIERRAGLSQRFTAPEVRSIASQLCAALQFAHRETVHRDIKPENIWLCEDGTIKVMDFGIARLLRPSQLTTTGMALGTAYYMAPEQLKAQNDVDHRADQYAVAVVAYELLTGRVPVGAIKPPRELRKTIPLGFSRAVMKALEGEPEARHADMMAFERASSGSSKRWSRPARLAAAACAVMVAAGGGYASWRSWTDWQARQAAIRAQAEETQRKAALEADIKRKNAAAAAAAKIHEAKIAAEAQAQYERSRTHAEELQKSAAATQSQLTDQAKIGADEVADILAELWRKHTDRTEWQSQGEERLKAAATLAQQASFSQAMDELKRAESVLGRPERWVKHARSALESIRKTRSVLDARLSKLATPSKEMLAWPEKLVAAVESKLVNEDGKSGLDDAQRLAASLPRIEKLLAARDQASLAEASAQLAATVNELRASVEEADVKLREADTALQAERLGDAERLYETARKGFAAAATRLLPFLESLVAEGETEVLHDHCDTALVALEPAVALLSDPAGSPAQKPDRAGSRWPAPLLVRFYLGRAEAYAGRGEYEKALADCTQALRADPQSGRVHLVRADVEFQQGVLEKALTDCEAAARLDPQNSLLAPRTRLLAMIDEAIVSSWGGEGDASVQRAVERALEQLAPRAPIDYADRGWLHGWMARKRLVKNDVIARDNYAERARSDFSEALRLDPGLARVDAWHGLFIFEYEYQLIPHAAKLKRHAVYVRAKQQCDEAVRKSPGSAELRLIRGRLLAHGDGADAARAIEDFNEAIRSNPNDADAFFARASSHAGLENHAKRVADCTAAMARNPLNIRYFEYRGYQFGSRLSGDFDKADLEKALADYTECIQIAPDGPLKGRHFANRGRIYFRVKDYLRAIADYTEGLRLVGDWDRRVDGGKLSLLAERAEAHQANKDYPNALADYTEVIKLAPDESRAYFKRGLAYREIKGDDLAIADLTAAINLDPTSAEAYTARGYSRDWKKQYDVAIADFNQAINLDPTSADAHIARGSARGGKGEQDLAIADFTEAIKLDPKSARAYTSRGVARNWKQQYDLAIADCTNAINLDPSFAMAYQTRGVAHDVKGEVDLAIADLTAASQLDPTDAETFCHRAQAYSHRSDWERTFEDLNQAIRLNPKHARAWFWRGKIYTIGGRDRSAEAAADRAYGLSLDPTLE